MSDNGKKASEELIELDFEVTSQKPAWLTTKLPTGETYRIRVSTMIESVRAKFVDGDVSFDVGINWRTKWEKVS